MEFLPDGLGFPAAIHGYGGGGGKREGTECSGESCVETWKTHQVMPRNRTEIGLKMSAKPKSNAVRGERPLFPNATAEVSGRLDAETADAMLPLLTIIQGQRTEQMYQLAEIFASIFEALPEEYERAIASTSEAA